MLIFMERLRFSIWLSTLIVTLISISVLGQKACLAWDIPKTIPGNYEGKWYGIHCPLVNPNDMSGGSSGTAFPDQRIIDSWGYKAKPLEEIKDLLPESYYKVCSNPELWGNFRINETEYIPENQWPGDYIELRDAATEKYRGQAFIDEYGHIRNHTAGIPFPGSTNADEIVWNFVKSLPEIIVARFYTNVTNKVGHTRYSVAEMTSLWWKGKLYGPDAPCIRPNPHNYLRVQAIGFIAPRKERGQVILQYRYDDPKKEDVQFVYLPFFRKYRRIAPQPWDDLPGGQSITHDSINGFDGRPANYKWEYLGRKLLLCGHNSMDRLMEIKGKPGGGGCDQTYQRVNCFMLQLTPKFNARISKGLLYLDPDSYACYYAEYFDNKGNAYLFHSLKYAVGKDGCRLLSGHFVADMKRGHSTSNYHYCTILNKAAVKEGRTPAFFDKAKLRIFYFGR